MKIPPRITYLVMAIAAIGLLACGWYLQHVLKERPCPLCILQRMAFIGIAAVSLVGAVTGHWPLARKGVAGGVGLFALAGLATSIKHVFFTKVSDGCGADAVAEFVNGLPTADWQPDFFFATGGCTDVYPPILGLTVPVWAFVWFVIFVAAAAVLLRYPRPASGYATWPDHPLYNK